MILNLLITFSAPRYLAFINVLSVFHAFDIFTYFVLLFIIILILFALQCMSFMIQLQIYTNVCMYNYISFLLLLQVICYLSDQVSRKFTLLHLTTDIFFFLFFLDFVCLVIYYIFLFKNFKECTENRKSHVFVNKLLICFC